MAVQPGMGGGEVEGARRQQWPETVTTGGGCGRARTAADKDGLGPRWSFAKKLHVNKTFLIITS